MANPKRKVRYKVGDPVTFTLKDGTYTGTVFIVDANGTFEYDGVSYDILVETPIKCLFKHIPQTLVDDPK